MRAPDMRRPARIVMPLQCDESTWAALDFAVAMAKALRAELKGTFLEDLDVLAAASLPITRAISYRSGQVGILDPAQVEAHYRALAARARERLAAACREQALGWSFEIAERVPAIEGEGEVAHHDLLLLDRRMLRRRQNVAALLRLATRYPTVGVWDMTMHQPSRLILVYRGEADGLDVAGELARAMGLALDVVIPDSDGKPGEPLAEPVQRWMADRSIAGTVHEFTPDDPARQDGLLRLTATPGSLVIYDRRDLLAMVGEAPG